jgi:DNA ligase 4
MEKFSHYKREDYEAEGIIPIEPMAAKEPLNEDELHNMLNSEFFYAEEKLDGVRATLHIRKEGLRLFSRRISKKTDWYAENSDNLPHIRDLEYDPRLEGTILDGELRIEGGDFKDISSVMNCLPQEAIKRQETLGKVVFHAFDIIYYRGIYLAKMPLYKRKELLSNVVENLFSPYIVEEFYTDKLVEVEFTKAYFKVNLSQW